MIDMTEGGPAFPVQDTVVDDKIFFAEDGHGGLHGMSLRDYFAAKAMEIAYRYFRPDPSKDMFSQFAQQAYRYADAMLAARGK